MTNAITKKRKKKGFTLIELIIVLGIMAILAAIAIPSFNSVRESSKTKADKESCNVIERTLGVLVADTTVSINTTTAKTFTITFGSASPYAIVKPFTYTAGFGTATDQAVIDEKAAIEAALTDVKKPQANGVAQFNVTIGVDGSVKAVTHS